MSELPKAREFVSGWKLVGLRDPTVFFHCVGRLLESGDVLILEEGSMAMDVRQLVEGSASPPTVRLRPGTTWPRSRMHWFHPRPATLDGLVALSNVHAEPEMCDHVYAVRNGELILYWPDAFFDQPLFLGEKIPEARIIEFGRAVGIQPESWQAG